MKADELIKNRAPRQPMTLSTMQRAELKSLLTHNDGTTNPARKVGRKDALAMLHAQGWKGSSAQLDALCVAEFKRRSYAKP